MAEFVIKDEDLSNLKDKVVVITGGSAGIGLATTKLLLSIGASVVNGDIQPPATGELDEKSSTLFVQTNVVNWTDLVVLFKKGKQHFGRIDSVFTNAGVRPRARYLEFEEDENGDLKEPNHEVFDINLRSVINTAYLGVHYMKEQPDGGSVVFMASSSAIQPFRRPDYSSAKHGVFGFGRGYARLVESAGLPIRVNVMMPSMTTTGMMRNMDAMMSQISYQAQTDSSVARCAALLMVDTSRHGEAIFVSEGKYKEVEKAILLSAYESIKGEGRISDDDVIRLLSAKP